MLMATNQKLKSPVESRFFGPGLIKFLFIVFLTVTIFLLVRSMLRHRFFSGGHPSVHSTAQ
jgi:hypothetical protein